jgi:UDP-N-acetylglucosamine 2-epimerase (non-hydrolysing)/GDP/UDP-N,N'-diacetylbacillosamine 2-epimerase (hydrolysing)
MWGLGFAEAFSSVSICIKAFDMLLILGDRFEILAAATAAHLQRIPIAHIGGGDVTEGSYDDAMRDCISRMASLHFCTSFASTARLVSLGYRNVHLVGNPAVDYIAGENWQREREIAEPYVVVSYQPETIDDTVDLAPVHTAIGGRKAIWISPNPDRGSDRIPNGNSYSHDRFLNLLYHCDEFIGNSSAIFYEAPFLKPGGVKCKLIGKRQRGRVVPWGGDGKASERIMDVLRLWPSS